MSTLSEQGLAVDGHSPPLTGGVDVQVKGYFSGGRAMIVHLCSID
jgi:hypothetical protein